MTTLVMSMDGSASDQTQSLASSSQSPMDSSSSPASPHSSTRLQESAEEDEQSRSSERTVVVSNVSPAPDETPDRVLPTAAVEHQPQAVPTRPPAGSQQTSAMVISREHSLEDDEAKTMRVDQDDDIQRLVHQRRSRAQEATDPANDPLVARMRDIVEGGSGKGAESTLGDEAASQKRSAQRQSSTQHQCGRGHHHHHHGRHHHHHHHRHQHRVQDSGSQQQRTSISGGPSTTVTSTRSAGQSTQVSYHHRHHHHHHHQRGQHRHRDEQKSVSSGKLDGGAQAERLQQVAAESKSSSSSVSSSQQQRAKSGEQQSPSKESGAEPKRPSVQVDRCPIHHNQPQLKHHHHHHHHHHHAHHCSNKRRLLADAKQQSGEVGVVVAAASGDKSARVPLQDVSFGNTGNNNDQSAVYCPVHEHQCRHHHHHNHRAHHHRANHERDQSGTNAAAELTRVQSLDQTCKTGARGHHHHHHHHHHHGHHHHYSHQHPRQRTKTQTSSSSKTNLAGVGGEPETNVQQNLNASDDENRMHLDTVLGEGAARPRSGEDYGGVVKMEMSPSSDFERQQKHPQASVLGRLELADDCEHLVGSPAPGSNQSTSTKIISSPNRLEQPHQDSQQTEATLSELPNVLPTGLPPHEVPESGELVKCDVHQANGEQKIGVGDGGSTGSKQDDQLVRQMSSSRENSKKSQQSRQNVTSGDGYRRPPQGQRSNDDGGLGGDDSIDCSSNIRDLQVAPAHSQQTASQPKQIVVSSEPVDRRCRLCWCCCCPCSALSTRSAPNGGSKTEQQGTSTDSPGLSNSRFGGQELPNVSLEEIRAWGDSFDRLMKSSEGRKVFQDFLRCEYSEENILFWIACEELKSERESKNIATKARDIYEDYISILSAKEVSLDSRVRDIINNNIKKPTSNIFDEAQLQIYTLMHRDSYPRFINSPMYKKLAKVQTTSRKNSS